MSVITAIKTAAETALGLVKANPVAAAGIAVGSVVVGYGGYRGVKYLRNRPAKQVAGIAPLAATAELGEAPAAAVAEAVKAQAVHALLSMTRAEAEEAGLLTEWNTELKAKLRAGRK